MPVECPLPFGEIMECAGCHYQSSDKCWWFFPARNIQDILTDRERLDTHLKDIHTPESEWSSRQWDMVNQLKAQVLYLQRNVTNTLKEIRTKKSNGYKYK